MEVYGRVISLQKLRAWIYPKMQKDFNRIRSHPQRPFRIRQCKHVFAEEVACLGPNDLVRPEPVSKEYQQDERLLGCVPIPSTEPTIFKLLSFSRKHFEYPFLALRRKVTVTVSKSCSEAFNLFPTKWTHNSFPPSQSLVSSQCGNNVAISTYKGHFWLLTSYSTRRWDVTSELPGISDTAGEYSPNFRHARRTQVTRKCPELYIARESIIRSVSNMLPGITDQMVI